MRYPENYPPVERDGMLQSGMEAGAVKAGTVLRDRGKREALMNQTQRVTNATHKELNSIPRLRADLKGRAIAPGATGYAAAVRHHGTRSEAEWGDTGAYINFLSDEGEARVRGAYPGPTWDRLAVIKARYDPTNLFRLNQNIPPAAGG